MPKNQYTDNKRKIKAVTRLPGFCLKWKGRRDSSQGQGVCDRYIEKLWERLGAIESAEVICAENTLHQPRRNAAVLLAGSAERRRKVRGVPDASIESSVESIRENRKNSAKWKQAKSDIESTEKKLTEILETIINVEVVLDERINKARKKAFEKRDAYLEGIHCGKIKNYSAPEVVMEDTARQIYHSNHDLLDTKIRETVGRSQNLEVVE